VMTDDVDLSIVATSASRAVFRDVGISAVMLGTRGLWFKGSQHCRRWYATSFLLDKLGAVRSC
jgi:hypothetical protein